MKFYLLVALAIKLVLGLAWQLFSMLVPDHSVAVHLKLNLTAEHSQIHFVEVVHYLDHGVVYVELLTVHFQYLYVPVVTA